jgi:hypothetical protein
MWSKWDHHPKANKFHLMFTFRVKPIDAHQQATPPTYQQPSQVSCFSFDEQRQFVHSNYALVCTNGAIDPS